MQYTMLNYGIVLNNAYTGKKQHIQNFLMYFKCLFKSYLPKLFVFLSLKEWQVNKSNSI